MFNNKLSVVRKAESGLRQIFVLRELDKATFNTKQTEVQSL